MAELPSSKSDKARNALPKGWPRPGGDRRRTGLNPKRQLILVALAFGGLAVGYILGSFTAPRPATIPEPMLAEARPPDPIGNLIEKQPVDELPTTKARPVEAVLPPAKVKPDAGKAVEESKGPEIAEYQSSEPKTSEIAPSAAPEVEAPIPATAAKRITTEESEPPVVEEQVTSPVRPSFTGGPAVVIVIDDLGVDQRRTARTTALQGPLTLSYLSYAENLGAQVARGRAAGHTIMMHVSMEPESLEVDPGPNVLLTGIATEELVRSLRWNLDQFEGYVGINNHMGSRFTQSTDGMRIVLKEVKRRGLFFLDSLTSQRSVAGRVASELGVPHLVRDIFIDHEDDRAAIRRQLAAVERLARRQGYAIGIAHPRDNSLAELQPWIAGLEAKGIRLVPITDILNRSQQTKAEHASHGAQPRAKPSGG